ncbi:hypothetical protein N0Y54_31810 [Nostoc punctiforme UO1]|uniref:hypothetical protein n=1 Tax=Nostoc punctiforme TaxID=272131 RepID=UPI0030A04043
MTHAMALLLKHELSPVDTIVELLPNIESSVLHQKLKDKLAAIYDVMTRIMLRRLVS